MAESVGVVGGIFDEYIRDSLRFFFHYFFLFLSLSLFLFFFSLLRSLAERFIHCYSSSSHVPYIIV